MCQFHHSILQRRYDLYNVIKFYIDRVSSPARISLIVPCGVEILYRTAKRRPRSGSFNSLIRRYISHALAHLRRLGVRMMMFKLTKPGQRRAFYFGAGPITSPSDAAAAVTVAVQLLHGAACSWPPLLAGAVRAPNWWRLTFSSWALMPGRISHAWDSRSVAQTILPNPTACSAHCAEPSKTRAPPRVWWNFVMHYLWSASLSRAAQSRDSKRTCDETGSLHYSSPSFSHTLAGIPAKD